MDGEIKMASYIVRRVVYIVPTLIVLSVISFIIIQLPPGDYLTAYIMQLEASGTRIEEDQVAALKRYYGLEQPMYVQYLKWMWRLLHGDLGRAFQWNKPVTEVLGERVLLTVIVSLATFLFTYAVAIPIGIYSAVRQYSLGDYVFTFIGFIGLATPSFLLALIVMFFLFTNFGISIGGLFSPEYIQAPWSWARFVDMVRHLGAPIIVIGVGGVASLIRVMRGCLLDELSNPYVVTARAKGLPERKLTLKYPVRIALNPIISTIGWVLPWIFSGSTITAIVLDLPTVGPMLLHALLAQDMYLAASVVMILSVLTIIGTLLSDILLAWLDPRIRYERR